MTGHGLTTATLDTPRGPVVARVVIVWACCERCGRVVYVARDADDCDEGAAADGLVCDWSEDDVCERCGGAS